MSVMATEKPNTTAVGLATVVNDMVARRAAHRMTQTVGGSMYARTIVTSCSCGWSASPSDDLRPQWAAIDEHLLGALPDWPHGVCWCGRTMLLSPFGKWFHVQPGTHGHDAAERGNR